MVFVRSRNAVRVPFGIGVRLRRNPQHISKLCNTYFSYANALKQAKGSRLRDDSAQRRGTSGSPLDDPHKGKNPAAVALGKLGGAKGGAARAAALSPAKRKAIAKKAAKARWGR
jgi:hypothetical protein